MDQACLNLQIAAALLDGLAGAGLQRLVLSPGSRSTPLVLAAEAHPRIAVDTVLDERSAAFFALGLAGATRRPVALVATSGSAPAHWYPAVIEAAHAGVPLVLMSADRPPELRHWGANQTIDQTRLFGPFVREFHDPGPPRPGMAAGMRALGRRAVEVSLAGRGPVHLNLPFPEPLVPADDCAVPAPGPLDAPAPAPLQRPAAGWREHLAPRFGGRGVVVCGPADYPAEFAAALGGLARRLALPVLADPLSGLRWAGGVEGCVTHYDALLRNPAAARALRPDWVLCFGRAPVSKVLNAWAAERPGLLVDPAGGWHDPQRAGRDLLRADPAAFCDWLGEADLVEPDAAWWRAWQGAEQRVEGLAAGHLAASGWHEGALWRFVLAQLPAGCDLFVANSLPIRQLDTWSGRPAASLQLFGNRGVSGIDGQISTLAGLNAGGRPTLGVIGDLAFWHDLGGLLLGGQLRAPLLVLNNGGGGIFGYLPQRRLAGFEAHWRTPVGRDIGAAVRGMGLPHWQVEGRDALAAAWAAALAGGACGVIEVAIDAAASQAAHEAYWRRVGDDAELGQS